MIEMGSAGKTDFDLQSEKGPADAGVDTHDLWRLRPIPSAMLDTPLDFIFADHGRQRQASALLMRIADGEHDREGVEELVAFLEIDFMPHFDDEELGLFPLLRQHCPPEDNIDALIERLLAEHSHDKEVFEKVVDLLKGLLGGQALNPDGARRVRTFAEHIRQHLAFENSVLLPIARVRLGVEPQKALTKTLKERRTIKNEMS